MQVKDFNKKKKILDSTNSLIINQGMENLSLSRVAKQSGISVGTIYIYFKDKDDLIYQTYIDRIKFFSDYINENISKHGTAVIKLTSFMYNIYQFGKQFPDQLLLIDTIVSSHRRIEFFKEKIEPQNITKRWYKLIEEGITNGEFRDIDPYATSFLIFHCIIGYLKDLKNEAYNQKNISIEEIIDMLITGLKK